MIVETVYEFELYNGRVRMTTDEDGEVFVLSRDVCDIVGFSSPSMINKNCDNKQFRAISFGRAGTQICTFVEIEQLIAYLRRSYKPEAKTFGEWLANNELMFFDKMRCENSKKSELVPVNNEEPEEVSEVSSDAIVPEEFIFMGEPVRVVVDNDEMWFVARDICSVLGLEVHNGLRNLPPEFATRNMSISVGKLTKSMSLISEAGVYFVISRSIKPRAVEFQKWICGTVTPSIRRTGGYAVQQNNTGYEILNDPDAIIAIATKWKQAQEENKYLTSKNEALEAQIESARPLVQYAKAVTAKEKVSLIGDFARRLAGKDTIFSGIGAVTMFKLLRDMKVLYKRGHASLPYQKYIDDGYFVVEDDYVLCKDGSTRIFPTTKVTGSGELFLEKLLREHISAMKEPINQKDCAKKRFENPPSLCVWEW